MKGITFIVITEKKLYCSELRRGEGHRERYSKREKKGSRDKLFYFRVKDRVGVGGIALLC